MGNCDTVNNKEKKSNEQNSSKTTSIEPNKGKPYYAAPIDDKNNFKYNPNIITCSDLSTSQNIDNNNTKLVKYCPKYVGNSQRSVLQATLVELGKNSLMGNQVKNSSVFRSGMTGSLSSIGEDSEVEIIQGGQIHMSALNKSNGKIDDDHYNQYVKNNGRY